MHGPIVALGLAIILCVGACMAFDRDRSGWTRLAGIVIIAIAFKCLLAT